MKRILWTLLLGILSFPLYAQTPVDVPMHIPPVTGTGASPEDNDIFLDLLNREMATWNFILTETPEEANYSLACTLAPSEEDTEEPTYILSLVLQDKEGAPIYEQNILYTTPEEANTYLHSTLLFMLSSVFNLYVAEAVEQVEIDPDAWRNKDWYFGGGLFWAPRLYNGINTEVFPFNFSLSLLAKFHFLQFAYEGWVFLEYVTAGTGIEIAGDWVVAFPGKGNDYRNAILQIPLSLNFVFKPGDRYMHEIYAGVLFNIPIFKETSPSPVSWDIGFQYGVKAGPGIFYADARFSMDFTGSGVNAPPPNDKLQYQRYMLYIGAGYKYG
jgi:hypothetical protein